MKIKIVIVIFLLILVGCSTNRRSPDFYPNQKLEEVGKEQARTDTLECTTLADEYVKDPEKWKDATATTAESTVTGGAVGAATGAIFSNAGRGLGAGAVGGVIIGLINSFRKSGQPDPNYEQFVGACLAEKGYRVYKWS